MSIPLVDLVAQYHSIKDEVDAAIGEVLESGVFILGPRVAAFEEAMAAYLGTRYAVGVASGTDALTLTLRAYGIGPQDEVIVPAFTFFATAESVSQVGATPVFVDIDPKTFCLDAAQLERRLTPKTRAIVPVHLFGHPADMGPIMDLATRRSLRVIEDNAQALGAEWAERRTGSLGDAACLSFFPTKHIGGYGDGGMVVTDDPDVAATVRKLRTHGWAAKYRPEMLGFNSRLDELQASILLVKLKHLNAWNERRRWIAAQYRELLAGSSVITPWEAPAAKHVYHLYIIRVGDRDRIHAHLRRRGIASGIYYPLPLHLLDPYRGEGSGGDGLREAERAAHDALAIPLYPELTDGQISTVAAAVREAVQAATTTRAVD